VFGGRVLGPLTFSRGHLLARSYRLAMNGSRSDTKPAFSLPASLQEPMRGRSPRSPPSLAGRHCPRGGPAAMPRRAGQNGTTVPLGDGFEVAVDWFK